MIQYRYSGGEWAEGGSGKVGRKHGRCLATTPDRLRICFFKSPLLRAHALDQMTPPYRIQRKRRIRKQTRIPTLFSKGVSTGGLYGGSLALTLNKQIGAI